MPVAAATVRLYGQRVENDNLSDSNEAELRPVTFLEVRAHRSGIGNRDLDSRICAFIAQQSMSRMDEFRSGESLLLEIGAVDGDQFIDRRIDLFD